MNGPILAGDSQFHRVLQLEITNLFGSTAKHSVPPLNVSTLLRVKWHSAGRRLPVTSPYPFAPMITRDTNDRETLSSLK